MESNNDNWSEKLSETIQRIRKYVIFVLTYVAYCITRYIVLLFQRISWGIMGVEYIRRDARRGLQYKQSAHVQDIIWRRKLYDISIAHPVNFITVHNGFKHPTYVLKQKVTLYCLTKHEAVFVETTENVDIYNSDVIPAFHNAQFKHAQKIITMPLASFHKMASDLGDPRMPIIWISRTWRCGSAIMRQMFESIPGTMVIGEPDALTSLSNLERDQIISKSEYKQLLESTIRILCKPNERAKMVCIKTRPCCFRMVPDIYSTQPSIRHIFMYRNSLKTVTSVLGTTLNSNILFQIVRFIVDNNSLSKILPCVRRKMYDMFGHLNKSDKTLKDTAPNFSSVGIIIAGWASSVSKCEELRTYNIPILPVIFEDLIKYPRKTCELLFEYFHIPEENVTLAVDGFRKDTRRASTILARLPLKNETRRNIEPEKRAEADAILKKYSLPKLGERYEIPGFLSID
ncbi:Hypothetical predicted protein [Octopus vulgaris]|uniref:Uncharacterized protein n=2 Tax=Octopus TaxID=6643 RepID=A0AA36BXH7_OCTVU|nr:uncharacterized protein LOC115225771 [Octopus sinensis]XP_036370505.1 uncharacterized protein LOC115225771 [Octopus sinensis]XP_036370506.1 uncharacterized protein LOC115225771 [Octopus sinensis]CAI9741809.1 Hypothetical predicted protein [Octopus vulgaris]